jgi:ABC-type dipeptide/oligopeptide/nickel transport system permease subunit
VRSTTLSLREKEFVEAALSFLGLGVPPSTPSWGQALSDASNGGLYKDAPWLMIFPGIFLVLTTLAFNLLGDGLRDALDPRSGR